MLDAKSSVQKFSTNSTVQENSTIARYHRVAMVEAVLSIRDRQKRTIRRTIVGALVLTGVAVIYAAVMGLF
jgi:hypothetical protein